MKQILKLTTCTLLLGTLLLGIVTFCSCKKELSCEGCKDTNKPPIANAGDDQKIMLPKDSVGLNGSASNDPDGSITSYKWVKISGPVSANIIQADSSRTMVKALAAGVYQFELTVTDNGGLSAKDTVRVMVDGLGNQPPVACAGADQVISLPANTVTLDGSCSADRDNNITGYSWTKISGPASFNITNANAVQTQVTGLVEGVYQFELKVTDAGGLFSRDTVRVAVTSSVDCNLQADWEIVVTLPIDSAFIDDIYRDTEGTCVTQICGPTTATVGPRVIYGQWVKNLVPGVYFFRRYWANCNQAAEIVKVTVVNDPNELNTITFKQMLWEYSYAADPNLATRRLFLSRPRWPTTINRSIQAYLQMDSVNNGQWFAIPSNKAGISFSLDCRYSNNICLEYFIIRVNPEPLSWDRTKANLKIKIL